MTSKEALDKYRKSTFIVGEILVTESKQDISTEEAIKRIRKTFNKYNVGFLTYLVIKQDLEKLEQLEIANKNNEGLVRENADLINRNLKLQDENQELKTKVAVLEGVNQAFRETAIECNKLKQAIEILTEVVSLNCDKTLETERQFLKLSQKQYELLKEVFENY